MAALTLAPTERPALLLLEINLLDLDGDTVARRLRARPDLARTPIDPRRAGRRPA